MRKLTLKQEKCIQEYLMTGNKTEAYKNVYNTSRMKPKTVHRKALEMFENGIITARLNALQKILSDKVLYNVKSSIKRDLELLDRYEKALDVLQNKNADKVQVRVAERFLKFIGSSGYNSIQDRLSKQLGFFENNRQKDGGAKVLI